MKNQVEHVMEAIDYIEGHLFQDLDLDRVAGAVYYSKYHLHRVFEREVGLTIHSYIKRRQLTEAAKQLVFSDNTIMEIALAAGYGSRQAFTTVFRERYKKTPNRYREEKVFYPLQLRCYLNKDPGTLHGSDSWQQRITFAEPDDISKWMELVHLVIDGFPYLDEKIYLARLRDYLAHKRALILKDGGAAVGIMVFQKEAGSIDFLGIHPQYRRLGIAKAFLKKAAEELKNDTALTVTTFREGDKADTGYRDEWKSLGFREAELLVEFGYPTQRFVLQRDDLKGENQDES